MAREPTDIAQLKLRIPEWLRLEVERAARDSGRSLNGELTQLIEEGLSRRETAAIINMAAKAGSMLAADRIQELLAPYLDRLAPANPNPPPPKDLAQVVEAMGRAVEAMTAMTIEATRERIEATRERSAARATVREMAPPQPPDFPK